MSPPLRVFLCPRHAPRIQVRPTSAPSPSGKAEVCKTSIPGSNPGGASNFSLGYRYQPIRNRLDMLLTGIKTPVGSKILGPDLNEVQRFGEELERVLRDVPGTRSVYAERVTQGYFTDIRIDREAIARHGLTIADVEDEIEAAVGGQNVTLTVEGRERYPVNVRYAMGFRGDLPGVQRVLVKTPGGAHIPLSQLAEIALTSGPAMIRDENAQLAGYVYLDTATRDIGGYVERGVTRARLEQEVARLGGLYAHVVEESIDSRRDDATGEAWLHGRFGYVLYGRPSA